MTNKVVVLGESSIGKTSLVYRMINDTFHPNYGNTVGAAFNHFEYKDVKIDVWDTAGQERYAVLASVYYRKSNVVLLVFDMSNLDTVDRVCYYFDRLISEMKPGFRCIVVGNKTDLVSEENIDTIKKSVKIRCDGYNDRLYKPIDYVYISAKNSTNIEELKDAVYRACLDSTPGDKADTSKQVVKLDIGEKSFSDRCC